MWIQVPWGAMRLSTALTALAVLLLLAWRSRSPWPGLLAVAAWLSAYEIVWNATDIAVHHWGWAPFWWWLTLSGWIILAWTRGVRPSLPLLAGFAVLWLAWLAAGFPYNLPGGPWSWGAEAWNLATKALLAAAFVVGDHWPAAGRRRLLRPPGSAIGPPGLLGTGRGDRAPRASGCPRTPQPTCSETRPR